MMDWKCVYGFSLKKRKYKGLIFKVLMFLFINLKCMFIYKYYMILRFIFGKIDIPYLQLVVTTKCTLKCKDCHDLMPYFQPEQHYTGDIEQIISDMHKILDNVDSIISVRLLGGEPLLFKEITQIITFLDNEKKIKSYDFITNGTIMPSNDLINKLAVSYKVRVFVDNYTRAIPPLLESFTKVVKRLRDNNIYCITLDWDNKKWFDAGRVYKRNREVNEIINNFLACGMYCVSLIGDECSFGKIFVCPRASSMSKLYDINNFNGDYIDLSSNNIRKEILRFYSKKFFNACDYCHDMSKSKEYIEAGIQLKNEE